MRASTSFIQPLPAAAQIDARMLHDFTAHVVAELGAKVPHHPAIVTKPEQIEVAREVHAFITKYPQAGN